MLNLLSIKNPQNVDKDTLTGILVLGNNRSCPVRVFRRHSGWEARLVVEIDGEVLHDCEPCETEKRDFQVLALRAHNAVYDARMARRTTAVEAAKVSGLFPKLS